MLLMWLWVLLAIIISGLVTGFIKVSMNVKIVSGTKYGEWVYVIADGMLSAGIGYLVLSAMVGHFLQ